MGEWLQDAIDKGLISVSHANSLSDTRPLEQHSGWWNIRAWIIATDQDLTAAELSIRERLNLRRN